eukprot:SAG31_NODE_18363_length_639_cov_0.761111_1_plen_80_part_01
MALPSVAPSTLQAEERGRAPVTADVKRRAFLALRVVSFAFDQARGNFAHQSDQALALHLCGGDSVRTVQLQTFVTSASVR